MRKKRIVMALINCEECGKEISDKALSCPNCGVPIRLKPDEAKQEIHIVNQADSISQDDPENKRSGAFSFIFTTALIFALIIVFIRTCSGNEAEKVNATAETEAAVINNEITEEQKNAAMNLIKINGYTCDSISGMNKFLTSEGYHVYCNEHRYSYDIENKGGNWGVTVQ